MNAGETETQTNAPSACHTLCVPISKRRPLRFISLSFTAVFVLATAGSAAAQAPDGAAVFQKSCASCHLQPPPTSRAPDRDALAQFAPESILTALTSGNMFR